MAPTHCCSKRLWFLEDNLVNQPLGPIQDCTIFSCAISSISVICLTSISKWSYWWTLYCWEAQKNLWIACLKTWLILSLGPGLHTSGVRVAFPFPWRLIKLSRENIPLAALRHSIEANFLTKLLGWRIQILQ